MGSGKSVVAAGIAKWLLNTKRVQHVIVLVPWKSIQGDVDKGMLGTFAEGMGIDARDHFFSYRRQARQPVPKLQATVTLYQEVCCQDAIETLKMWVAEKGFTFALICDEIHHTNEINSTWGVYVEQFKSLAAYSVFMSGTFFRTDRHPISCIPLDANGDPIKDYRFTYKEGVRDNVVRAVTTREVDAHVILYDKRRDTRYERMLSEITDRDLSAAKRQVLDPAGECMRNMIETVHGDLQKTRTKFCDAACLFVCRPGGSDDFTRESEAGSEDRNVLKIASQIETITGEKPVVVTHHDTDAAGKIARFRRGTDPYLVAINMVSEGCDIPRLRSVAFCRFTKSQMLFRQIVGRALRMHTMEDGTAAQIYIPAFPKMLDFARALYSEAKEGVSERRPCDDCGKSPCECPCPSCGKRPCECEGHLFPPEPAIIPLDAIPVLDGGHVGHDKVTEDYVGIAEIISREDEAHRHSNRVQLGHVLQRYDRMRQHRQVPTESPPGSVNPLKERERLCRQINRRVRRLGYHKYGGDYQKAFVEEIERRFGAKFSAMQSAWTVDQLRPIAEHLENRMMEVFRA